MLSLPPIATRLLPALLIVPIAVAPGAIVVLQSAAVVQSALPPV
jgi:hypothetical protein